MGEVGVVEEGGAKDVGVIFFEGVGEVGGDACECVGLCLYMY